MYLKPTPSAVDAIEARDIEKNTMNNVAAAKTKWLMPVKNKSQSQQKIEC